MSRTPAHTVSRRRRAQALNVLAAVVADDAAPTHARVAAARTLVQAEPKEPEDESDETKAPGAIIFLPDNGRDRRRVRLGPQGAGGSIIYDSMTPEGLADMRRWRAEAEAAGHQVIAPQ
jgi:hypothetical protein